MAADLYTSIIDTLDELYQGHLRLELPPDRKEMAEAWETVERIEAILIEASAGAGGSNSK